MSEHQLPTSLQNILDELSSVDPETRADMLIEFSDQFKPVPPEIAAPPYLESNRVPGCESEVFAFSSTRDDGTKEFHFAVENPQGISAMALAAILQEGLNGSPLDLIQNIPEDIVTDIFGRTLSMGKGQGLMSMMAVVKALARR